MTTAAVIARRALRACRTNVGLVAGTHHFVDLWARDSLFAAFGADRETAKVTLETFLKFQREDGAIPYRIFRRAGLLLPNFRSIQSGGFVPDGGLMAIIVAQKFGKTYKSQIQRARRFYESRFGENLISEWFQCEWQDAVLKVGKTLYTNVLYWFATRDENMKKKIVDTFWNGIYFSDWVDYKRHDYFAVLPNMLSIIFGLASRQQAQSILQYAKEYCWRDFTLVNNHPKYPMWRIPIQNHVSGTADYSNGSLWLQPGILYAVALHKLGYSKEAKYILQKISKKIVEFGDVYEKYENNGAPLKRFFYQSERSFAWSAGLYLWASHILSK